MRIEDLPDILTVADIKEFLNISQNGAYSLCRQKNFPAIKFGRIYRIPKAAFQRWLEQEAEGMNAL